VITLTEAAAERLRELFLEQESENAALRVFVKGDENGTPQFGMSIEPNPAETDEVIESYGVKVVVDEESLPWVIGSEIDYVDSLMRAGFTIRNPNVMAGCGCGGGGGACACGAGAAQTQEASSVA
jgi:iron-sulfur cluster assembly accessory protein